MTALPSPEPAPSPPQRVNLRRMTCGYCRQEGTLRLISARLARCGGCRFLAPLPRTPREAVWTEPFDSTVSLGAGTVLRERYRLVDLLGKGRHGLTLLAEHQFLNHPCVVKVLPHRVADASDAAVRRLRHEASAGFRVNHPNVVRVLDCDAIEGLWYFVMEYVDGVDLAAPGQRNARVDWRQAVRVLKDAAAGLQAIHEAGLIHRDVKPGNLLLATDGRVRIADLGVAAFLRRRPAGPAERMPQPRTGTPAPPAGTLAYAAPEVLRDGGEVGPSADLYSLGAATFDLVTGRPPRAGSVYRAVLSSSLDPIQWPADAPDDVPEWFIDAVMRLLSEDPADRFTAPADLLRYLETPTSTKTSVPARPAAEPTEPRGMVVLPFENATEDADDDWLGHALADHVARWLGRQPGVYMIEREQFLQTAQRAGNADRLASERRYGRAGRLLGAGTVVEGCFRRSGAVLEIDVRVTQASHTGTGRNTPCAKASGPLASLAELEADLCRQLAGAIGLSPAVVTQPAEPDRAPLLEAEEAFFSGKRAFLRGDYETARNLGLRAVELDPDFAEAIGFVGVCCARMGRYDKAVEHNRQQEALARRTGRHRMLVEAHANRGAMHYFRGEYVQARDAFAQAAAAAEKLGLTAELAQIHNNLAFALLQLGRAQEAEATFRRAIDAHRAYGALVSLVGPYNGLGHVLLEQKRYDEARGYFSRALALAQESDDQVNGGIGYMNLGHCALLQGRLADAKQELALALNILEDTSFWNGLARVYELMAELNLRLGNSAEATRCADRRIVLAQRHKNRRMQAAAWRQKAAALEQAGRRDEADVCRNNANAAEEPTEGK